MRLVMMGTGTFAEPTFEALLASGHDVVALVTQPDRAVGDKRSTTRQTGKGMKEIALAKNLPVHQPESINTPESLALVQSFQADLLVVAAYGQILAKDVLAAARLGGINVHASLLPKYRGAAPIAWAIYHGDAETGVTIIHMTPALDAGDMLAQRSIAIAANDTAGDLEPRLGTLGAEMVLDVLPRLEAGTAQAIVQDRSLVSKAPKLTKEMGLIDWTRPASAVWNQIRAFQPWPGPYCFLHRAGAEPMRILIFQATPMSGAVGEPGAVRVDDKRLFVGADGGWLEVLELQPAGKRRMNAADFLRGNVLGPEARFGPG